MVFGDIVSRKHRAGVISKTLTRGALGGMSESRCGLFAATPIFFEHGDMQI